MRSKKLPITTPSPCTIIAETTPGDRYRAIENGCVLADLPISLLGGAAPEIIWKSTPPANIEERWQNAVVDSNQDANAALRALLSADSCTRADSTDVAENPADELFAAGLPRRDCSSRGNPAPCRFCHGCRSPEMRSRSSPRSRGIHASGIAQSVCMRCRSFRSGQTGLILDHRKFADRFWELEQSILGISDAARALECPVVSGNVSLYNESKESRILPHPLLVAAGCIESPSQFLGSGKWNDGDLIFSPAPPLPNWQEAAMPFLVLKTTRDAPQR